MESSAVVAFRALIMVACLVLVPLAAIFGSAFPDLVKANLVERFWPGRKQQVAQNSSLEAPHFGDSTALNHSPVSGSHEAAPAWATSGGDASTAVRAVGNEAGGETSRATPAQFSAPAESSSPPWPPAASGYQPQEKAAPFDATKPHVPINRAAPKSRLASGNPLASSERLTPAESQPPAGRAAFHDRTASPVRDNLSPRQSTNVELSQDRPTAYGRVVENPHVGDQGEAPTGRPAGAASADFKATERRLRQYGAAYYRLETVGKDGLEYRFYCMMPAAAGVQNPRHFEAIDSDPLAAMTHVADDVQAWLDGK